MALLFAHHLAPEHLPVLAMLFVTGFALGWQSEPLPWLWANRLPHDDARAAPDCSTGWQAGLSGPEEGALVVIHKGCCCGRTDRGNPAVPVEFYEEIHGRRGIRKHVQLTMSSCIGPCPMLDVVQVVFDGRPVWFQSINARTKSSITTTLTACRGRRVSASAATTLQLRVQLLSVEPYQRNERSAGGDCEHQSERLEGGILFLTHADTDLQCLDRAARDLPEGFPAVCALLLEWHRQPRAGGHVAAPEGAVLGSSWRKFWGASPG